MPYQPKHQPQLGRGIPVPGRTRGSRDCGPRSWQMAMDARSGGRVAPGVWALRRRGQVPGPQPTNITDAKHAIHGWPVPGRTPLRYWRIGSAARLRQAVRKGRPVHLAIDYGAWNALRDGKTGDPRFRGGHSVMVYGQRKVKGVVQWQLYDPLEDARRKGIPQGPTWVPRHQLITAARSLGGIFAGWIGGSRDR